MREGSLVSAKTVYEVNARCQTAWGRVERTALGSGELISWTARSSRDLCPLQEPGYAGSAGKRRNATASCSIY